MIIAFYSSNARYLIFVISVKDLNMFNDFVYVPLLSTKVEKCFANIALEVNQNIAKLT